MKAINPVLSKRLTCYLCFLLVHFCVSRGYSQERKQPIFHGTIKNNRFDGKPDTLSIKYLKPFTPTGEVTIKLSVIADKEGRFSFKLPHFDHPIKMIVSVRLHNRSERVNDGYLVHAEDSVRMDIVRQGDQLKSKFYGKGAEKYNVGNSLDSLLSACSEKRANGILANRSLKYNLELLNKLIDSHEIEKQQILDRSRLSTKDKALVKYAYGNLFDLWFRTHSSYMQLEIFTEPNYAQMIRDNFNTHKEKYRYPIDSLMVHAGNFLFHLGFQEAKEVWMSNAPLKDMTEHFYNQIKQRYSGMMRERLIANFFIGNTGLIRVFEHSAFRLDSLMADGEQYITIPYVKKRYSDKLRLATGKPVFDAVFKGLDGKDVKISDLKGKVVFLDMWANACSWCAIMHDRFHKEVWPEFKGNENFVVLSINSGDRQESWKANIKKGIYTSSEYLNVSADRIDHPFNQHYSIQGLPFLLLIDKEGKIVSNKPNDVGILKNTIKVLLAQ